MSVLYHDVQGGISSSVLSVFFTDNCYKLLKSLHLIGWEQICQWKTLTKRLMKCPPGGSINSEEYNSFDIDALTIKISMAEYHHLIIRWIYGLF